MSLMAAVRGKGEGRTDNLIRDGSLFLGVNAWYRGSSNLALAHAPSVSRSTSSGALAITTSDEFAGTVFYRPTGLPAVALNGATEIDLICYGKSANASALVTLAVDFRADAHFIASTLGAEGALDIEVAGVGWTEVASRAIEVPLGATHVGVYLTSTVPVGANPVYLDDIYVGPAGDDDAPYPAASTFPVIPNRFYNGGWEVNDAFHFRAIQETETFSRDTVAPIAGTASPKVLTPGDDPEEGITWGVTQAAAIPVIPGEPLRISFKIKGSGVVDCFPSWAGASGEVIWTGTAIASPATIIVDLTVPVGAYALTEMYWWTSDSEDPQAVTFWIDDVFVGTAP